MVREEEVGGAVTHEMDILGPHTSRVASSLRSASTGQHINDEAEEEQPAVVSQAEGVTSIRPFCIISRRLFCSVTGFWGGIPRDTTSDSESEEPRMFGDFDDGANRIWTLYSKEAKNYDGAQIYSLKEYMASAVIFVCSYPICACMEPRHTDA